MISDLQKNLYVSENLSKLIRTTKEVSSKTILSIVKKSKSLFNGSPTFIPKFDYSAYFSIDNFNQNLKNIEFDLSVLFEAIKEYRNTILSNSKLAVFEELKLTSRLKNYSKIIDTIQYGAPAIVETFQSLAMVNTDLTSATVDTVAGSVLNSKATTTENSIDLLESNSNALYTILTAYKKVSIISGNLLNIFKDNSEEFKISVQTTENICSATFSITLIENITTLTVDLGSSSPARIELFDPKGVKLYDSVDYLFIKNQIYLNSGSSGGIYNIKITKNLPELVFNNLKEFILGIKNITAYQTTTANESCLVTKPLYFSDSFENKIAVSSFVLMAKDFGNINYYFTTETPNQNGQFESIIASDVWSRSSNWKKIDKNTIVNLIDNSSKNYSFSFDASNKAYYKVYKLGETASNIVFNIGQGFAKYVEDAVPETKQITLIKKLNSYTTSFEITESDIPSIYSDYSLIPLDNNTGIAPIAKITFYDKEIPFNITKTATGYFVKLSYNPLNEEER